MFLELLEIKIRLQFLCNQIFILRNTRNKESLYAKNQLDPFKLRPTFLTHMANETASCAIVHDGNCHTSSYHTFRLLLPIHNENKMDQAAIVMQSLTEAVIHCTQ